jgi:hypothetical protein
MGGGAVPRRGGGAWRAAWSYAIMRRFLTATATAAAAPPGAGVAFRGKCARYRLGIRLPSEEWWLLCAAARGLVVVPELK